MVLFAELLGTFLTPRSAFGSDGSVSAPVAERSCTICLCFKFLVLHQLTAEGFFSFQRHDCELRVEIDFEFVGSADVLLKIVLPVL